MIRNYRERLLTRRRILSASDKYKPGDFGYSWLSRWKYNEDLDGTVYKGATIHCNIMASPNIRTLKGCPKIVYGDFYCDFLRLKTLEGAPEKIYGSFYCYNCRDLISLKGGPKYVEGEFCCYGCTHLTSLEYAPKYVGGIFDCRGCHRLKSLDGIGEVKGRIYSDIR